MEAEGSGSRHRRRRGNRGEAGDQPVNGHSQQNPEPAKQRGNPQGQPSANAASIAKPDSRGAGAGSGVGQKGRGRYRQNGYGDSRGQGEWRGNADGYGGAYHRDVIPPPPAWPPAPGEHSLKDLLLQVAPQARIAENTSRLSSKASVNILSKVMATAAQSNTQACPNEEASYSGDHGGSGGFGGTLNYGGGAYEKGIVPEEDEDESAFMERWSGLFSKGSPLVDGSLEDPFEDVKKRAKVVWKKHRPGHKQRYQQRKSDKEKEDGAEAWQEGAGAVGEAEIVYDASPDPRTQWRPQRPPAGM